VALPHKSRPAATDAMVCRACGNQERASEGYPCIKCGTFICVMCTLRGIALCKNCSASIGAAPDTPASDPSPKPPATQRA